MLNDIYHLRKQVYILKNYFNCDFLYIMPENFFELLTGDNNIFSIKLDNPLLYEILVFTIILIMISGRTLDIQINNDIINIINYRPNKNNLKLPIKKIFFQNEIDYIENNNKPEICLLTCNRYKQLERCIKSYLDNLSLFGHNNVNFTIFDDSRKDIDKNIKISESYNIKLISLEEKYKYVNFLINNIFKYPEYIINSVNHTFGNYNINPSFGRNRNFISFFMKDKSYISIDDDSIPFVLTYKPEYIKYSIENFIRKKNKDFKFLKFFVPENSEKILIPVDFYYKFKYSNINEYQYVKYSGNVDMELMLMFFQQLGIDLNNSKILEYMKEALPIKDSDTRLFMREIKRDSNMRGLSIFYPSNTFDFRVTTADDYRIEDLILGTNYLISTKKIPLEVNISLYHDKDLNFYMKFEDIIKEFNGTVIYSFYYNLMKKIVFNTKIDPVSDLFNSIKDSDINFFDNKNINEVNINRKKILNLFNGLSKDFPIVSSFIPKLEYFFSLFDIHYLNNESNRVIRNLSHSMIMWKELKDYYFL